MRFAQRILTQEKFEALRLDGFPARWRGRLQRGHRARMDESLRDGNLWLIDLTDSLSSLRLPLNATDVEVCAAAERLAVQCMDVARIQQSIEAVRAGMEQFCRNAKVEPPARKVADRSAILRMTCPLWWRRNLRKLHAKAVEGAAIELGYVNRSQDCYVSEESLQRRAQQIARNKRTLERVTLENEHGQQFTIAELAARGVANKAIRRGELMTRIAGFEQIARECGHDGLFLTVTCPSRMHKFSVVPGTKRVFENKNYDGTSPKQAQAYLAKVWAAVRAKLQRMSAPVYGFRIAEPHHDACPHWHLLLFVEPVKFWDVVDVVNHHGLKDTGDEPGAWRHRVEAVRIDFESGSAAGYIAKYVAKNIDGLHVEADLFGNPAMETSARVEAWASTWGIRQFQQIGGAPVGVWRELRRVKEVPQGAPEHLAVAHRAVNRIQESDGQKVKAASFAEYVKAQGGVFIGRDYAIRMATEPVGEVGRYGEEKAEKIVGVEVVGAETYRDGIVPDRVRLVHWLVESVRYVWRVIKGGFDRAAVFAAPRTRVNNCTHGFEGMVFT
jgi:hypothetical protein